MMNLDSEIPRQHPNKRLIEQSIREVLLNSSGPWNAWLHVAAQKSACWFLEVRGRNGMEHALLFNGPEEQAPHFIKERLQDVLRGVAA